jgi:enterochelin esterase-like enzyme
MKPTPSLCIIVVILTIGLSACRGPVAAPPLPTPMVSPPSATATLPACTENGTLGTDWVPQPTQGFSISFQYYLPPCYASRPETAYPVLYLITLTEESSLSDTDNTPLSLANRLIRAGKLPPAIAIVPDTEIGYGSDAALAQGLVPYVDGKFRTLRDRLHRGVGGLSHGAAIAVRMAFQFPETFGSAGLLSGGIADGEDVRFTQWIQRTPPDLWPRVHIDVGDQDPIIRLTRNLTAVLDANAVPYTLNIGSGTHSWSFWSPLMEPFLIWFSQAWK